LQYAGGDDLPIKEVQRRLFTTEELAAAAEAFAISSFIGEHAAARAALPGCCWLAWLLLETRVID
jgi:hypothetical protein